MFIDTRTLGKTSGALATCSYTRSTLVVHSKEEVERLKAICKRESLREFSIITYEELINTKGRKEPIIIDNAELFLSLLIKTMTDRELLGITMNIKI